MKTDSLRVGKTYTYSSNLIDVDVIYDGIESEGLTFYKFKSISLDVPYRLWAHEVETKITEK